VEGGPRGADGSQGRALVQNPNWVLDHSCALCQQANIVLNTNSRLAYCHEIRIVLLTSFAAKASRISMTQTSDSEFVESAFTAPARQASESG